LNQEQPSLRVWPGVAIVVLQWLARFVVPIFAPGALAFSVLSGLAGGLAVLVWWVFFSRAPWSERLGAVVLMVAALVATSSLIDVSILTGGQGLMFPIFAVPTMSLAFVVWAVATRHLPTGQRRAALGATVLLVCGAWTLVRIDGITGDFNADFAWRWAETHEERLLAAADDEPGRPPLVSAAADTGVGWPGFRGPERDGVVRGVRIDTDWSTNPPVELWRRPIGPGWSSFAVRGDLLFTQEQRGDDEVVAAYDATTGAPVWRHRDEARFWESHGGAGPRATPTLRGDRVYTFGATGILNALDAADGTVVWSRNVASDTGAQIPGWGFAGSPLIVGDVVVVAASGQIAAYDIVTGESRWSGPAGGYGYSSPHLLTIDGVAQVVLMSAAGASSFAPADGAQLWEHAWPPGARIVQPAMTADGDLLISGGEGTGMRRIAVARGAGAWTVEERWTSIRLKPYFSDFVVHEGHAYGFDGSILACIDVRDGQRKWKGGRYGQGQLVLLPDQDVLLVITEEGDLALVSATPEGYSELATVAALNGKTWNHPVLAGDLLLVRNAEEMVAFRLKLAPQ